MSRTLSVIVVGLAAAAFAAPALAGPVGEGRGFTEETARKALAQRTVKVAGSACAQRAVSELQGRPGVVRVAHRSGGVEVTFRSPEHAAQQEAEVRATVTSACRST